MSNDWRILETILDDERPAERFAFFKKYADALDFWGDEAERLAEITRVMVLREPNCYRGETQIVNETGDTVKLKEMPPEDMIRYVRERLAALFDVERETLEAVGARNREFADYGVQTALELPEGTLTHYSDMDGLPYILSQGNLCGECLGFESKADSYPFFVDTIRVTGDWESRKIKDIMATPNRHYRESGLVYVYPFREDPQSFFHGEEFPAPGSMTTNHTLSFVGVPRQELGAIVYLGTQNKENDEAAEIEKIKQHIIKNDMYVPLFDREGKLLFTHEEFETAWRHAKPYGDARALLVDRSYLDGLDVKQTSGIHEFTLRDHLLHADAEATRLAHNAGLSDAMIEIVRVAARLHDLGKESRPDVPQEVANVEAAEEILSKVQFLLPETRRRICMLIRHDELLGEVLKGTTIKEGGEASMSDEAQEKLKRFNDIFRDPEMRQALLAVYRADVLAIGNNVYEEWEVDAKLKALGLI